MKKFTEIRWYILEINNGMDASTIWQTLLMLKTEEIECNLKFHQI